MSETTGDQEKKFWKIYPLYQGSRDMDLHDILYRKPVGEIVKMAYGAFLLRDEDGESVMVDTGAPSCEEIESRGYPFRHTSENFVMADQVRKNGVSPEEIRTVIYTHLHWDHAWNTADFPNAEFIVQEEEMNSAVHPLKMARKSYGFIEESGGPDWIRAIMRFRPIRGDRQLFSGIRVITTPGHTSGSQSVIVTTRKGDYLLPGDWITNLRSIKEELPSGSNPDVPAWYDSLDKVRGLHLTGILPCHDMITYEQAFYG